MTIRTDTTTLAEAMRILSREIQSDDGVANAAIHEAALRMEEQREILETLLPILNATSDAMRSSGPHGFSATCDLFDKVAKRIMNIL